jgi:opacity protein-like surface antigen
MVFNKAVGSRCVFLILALALQPIISTCLSAAELYVRPLVQYTWLPTSSRKADTAPFYAGDHIPAAAAGVNNVVSSDSIGAGLAVGAAFGREQRFEVGAEVAETKFNGTYTLIPYGTYTSSGTYVPAGPPIAGQPFRLRVTSAVATFRRWFGRSTDELRPFLGAVVGFSEVTYYPGARDPSVMYFDTVGDSSIIYGLGGGVRYRVGRNINIEASYRFVEGGGVFSHNKFYSPAHIFSFGVEGRF